MDFTSNFNSFGLRLSSNIQNMVWIIILMKLFFHRTRFYVRLLREILRIKKMRFSRFSHDSIRFWNINQLYINFYNVWCPKILKNPRKVNDFLPNYTTIRRIIRIINLILWNRLRIKWRIQRIIYKVIKIHWRIGNANIKK